jgi:thimet oligopeptidase
MTIDNINYDFKAGDISMICDQAIEVATKQLDSIAATSQTEATIHNKTTIPTFMAYVAPSQEISDEASKNEEKLRQFEVSIYTRKDLYDILVSLKTTMQNKGQEMTWEETRLYKETLASFEDNGLQLPEEKLKKVKELKQHLATLETQFSTNLNQENSFVEYELTDLDGLPEDFLKTLEKVDCSDTKVRVNVKEPHYVRIMENAKNSETRRKMLFAFENRATEKNIPLLEEEIEIRGKIAELMGYSNFSDYQLHRRMAKDSKTVWEFLNGLKNKLSKRNQDDLARLLLFKQEELGDSAESKSLNAWDLRYYANQVKKRDYQLDDEKIREYFPADKVVKVMFEVYSQLLGVEYIQEQNPKTWAEDVQLYRITNKNDTKPIAYFYTDLLPRKNKFSHAAAFSLIKERKTESGERNLPVSAMVANFTPAEGGKPILLSHNEVVTLFHEFGHINHQVLSTVKYASLSGTSVDTDFVESPSQLLENWVFEADVLRQFSGHYLDHNNKLPDSLIEQIVRARDFNQGYFYTRQLVFGIFDMNCYVHRDPNLPTRGYISDLYRKWHQELVGIPAIEGSNFPASFGHIGSGGM